MGKIALKIVEFFYRRKVLFFVFLLALSGFIAAGISRLHINQNIFASLPKGKVFEQFNKLIESKNIANSVVFSIAIPDNSDDDVPELVTSFADSLRNIAGNYLTGIAAIRPDVEEQFYQYYITNLPYLIDTGYYSMLDSKLIQDSVAASVTNTYNQLVSPGSAFLKKFLLHDPVGISGRFFKQLQQNAPQGFAVEDGVLYSKDHKKALITAKTSFAAGNSANNILLFNVMEAFKARWNARNPLHELTYFGTFQIAAENALQVKKDTRLTVTFSVVMILLLLLVYYRKALIPVYFFLPAVFGAAMALGIIGFIRPEISAISLATGAVLMGIIVDYSFHFFTHLRHTRSIEATIRDIGMPLLTGSFTTITALAALCFSNSVVLQDFGLIAALSLSGAVVFTLTGLPIILKIVEFSYTDIPEEKELPKGPSVLVRYKWPIIGVIAVITIVCLRYSGKVQFDSDMEHMSVHSESLINAEQQLTGINPKEDKKIYLFVTNKVREAATLYNFKLYEELTKKKAEGKIKTFLSAAQFVIPEQIKEARRAKWMNYWADRKAPVFLGINKQAHNVGLTDGAFNSFEQWINTDPAQAVQADSLRQQLGLNDLIDNGAAGTTLITTVVVSAAQLQAVKQELRQIEGVELFDRAEVASSQLELVKNDFNYLFWVSATIVFFTLLLIYGRIELTLLAFLPMVISWIWILGFAAMLGIKFNFVNVVISTFIFGLGDDFSIFVTDGLLSKYKYRNNALGSYTSAIVLSATGTVIGLGALFFAKHPAIHSIAAISVLGIACILFLSLTFQPILFDLFVLKRLDKHKPPVRISEFLYSLFEFSYFIGACLFFYSVLGLFFILPAPKKYKVSMLNGLISLFTGSVIYLDLQVKKNIIGRENLDVSKPSILIANHSSFLDILLMSMLNRKIILMVNEWVYKSPLFGFVIRYAGYIYAQDGAEENLEVIKQRVADGYSILIFPEGRRSVDEKINRFHKGAFLLSQELQLDITPVLLHGVTYVLPKNDYIVKAGEMTVKILPRIKYDDASWGPTYRERTKSISAYFKREFQDFSRKKENADYLWHRVFNNYIYKGPVIEWYIRVKWKLERRNYEYYNELIGYDRKQILDIGCGYGYLALFLHYKHSAREIVSIDYDEEKIQIAANCFDKGAQVKFLYEDVRNYTFGAQDVVFLNDSLHYLQQDEQDAVLEKCAAALNDNGILFIREGVTNLEERHKKTQLTEFFSSKVMGFNKKENEFHFISVEYVQAFAARHNLKFEMQEHSRNTSNVLFILRK